MTFTKADLINCFDKAVEEGAKFIGVLIKMGDLPKNEVIINEADNIAQKVAYYYNTYDGNLNHKFSQGISIVGCAFGNSFSELQSELMNEEKTYVHPVPKLITITMTEGQWRKIHNEASGHLAYLGEESETVDELEYILDKAQADAD